MGTQRPKARSTSRRTSIREAALEDARQIASLVTALGYPTNANDMRARLEGLLADGAYVTFVAELGGEIIGSCGRVHRALLREERHVRAARRAGRVGGQPRQGRGGVTRARGRALGERKGAAEIFLNSGVQREGARRFYEKLGYRVTGVRFSKELPASEALEPSRPRDWPPLGAIWCLAARVQRGDGLAGRADVVGTARVVAQPADGQRGRRVDDELGQHLRRDPDELVALVRGEPADRARERVLARFEHAARGRPPLRVRRSARTRRSSPSERSTRPCSSSRSTRRTQPAWDRPSGRRSASIGSSGYFARWTSAAAALSAATASPIACASAPSTFAAVALFMTTP